MFFYKKPSEGFGWRKFKNMVRICINESSSQKKQKQKHILDEWMNEWINQSINHYTVLYKMEINFLEENS